MQGAQEISAESQSQGEGIAVLEKMPIKAQGQKAPVQTSGASAYNSYWQARAGLLQSPSGFKPSKEQRSVWPMIHPD
jgi:hypothetical protein